MDCYLLNFEFCFFIENDATVHNFSYMDSLYLDCMMPYDKTIGSADCIEVGYSYFEKIDELTEVVEEFKKLYESEETKPALYFIKGERKFDEFKSVEDRMIFSYRDDENKLHEFKITKEIPYISWKDFFSFQETLTDDTGKVMHLFVVCNNYYQLLKNKSESDL